MPLSDAEKKVLTEELQYTEHDLQTINELIYSVDRLKDGTITFKQFFNTAERLCNTMGDEWNLTYKNGLLRAKDLVKAVIIPYPEAASLGYKNGYMVAKQHAVYAINEEVQKS